MSDTAGGLRELFSAPGLLSLSRVVMGAFFPWVADRPWLALGVMAAAGLSDVLDGEVARRTGHSSVLGAALDPIADKLFATSVVLSLVWIGKLPVPAALMLCARELAQVPLSIVLAVVPRARRVGVGELKSNRLGKVTTFLQFVALCAVLFGSDMYVWAVVATAAVGVLAAVSYWKRFFRLPVRGPSGADNGLAAGQHPR